MSWVMNTKHCTHEDVLSEFRVRLFCLVAYRKHHIPPSGSVSDEGLQSWGISGGSCMLDLLLSSCPVCAASELLRTRYWTARHIHCSCEFADYILSAMAICWSSEGQNILFAQFSLCALYQHRENIPIYLFFSALKLDHSTHESCSIAGNVRISDCCGLLF